MEPNEPNGADAQVLKFGAILSDAVDAFGTDDEKRYSSVDFVTWLRGWLRVNFPSSLRGAWTPQVPE